MPSVNEEKPVVEEPAAETAIDLDASPGVEPALDAEQPAGRLRFLMDEDEVLGLHHRLASRLFRLVRKRSGKIVPFERTKITSAIFKAAQEVGGRDLEIAERLTDEVLLYLYSEKGDNLPQVEEIQDAIEKVLIERGHAKTAKAFILYRDKRMRVRRKDVRADLPGLERKRTERVLDATDLALFVRTSADDMIVWDREQIVEALVRETLLDRRPPG